MTDNRVLSTLGLFIRPGFLDKVACARLCDAITCGDLSEAEIYDGHGPTVAPAVRKTRETSLAGALRDDVQARMNALIPALTSHFDAPIRESEGTTFLMYEAGGFFRPHRDRGAPGTQRRVSAVAFLNEPSTAPGPMTYSGGRLILYGLVPEVPDVCFPVDPEPGLLVAFDANILHEVTLVLEGRRLTAVDWFF